MSTNYSNLQNGSDIRGVAVAGENPLSLGKEEAIKLSAAFGTWLASRCQKSENELKISVGQDHRRVPERSCRHRS